MAAMTVLLWAGFAAAAIGLVGSAAAVDRARSARAVSLYGLAAAANAVAALLILLAIGD